MGKANTDCNACLCKDHTVLGSVRRAGSLPAPAVAILLSGTSPKLLTLSDHNGHFRVPGICPDGNTTLLIRLQGHTPQEIVMPLSSDSTTVLHVKLERASKNVTLERLLKTFDIKKNKNPTLYLSFSLEKLYVQTHPESKARRTGQTAAFCCKVTGTPEPDEYQW